MLDGEVLRGRDTNDGTPGRLTLPNFQCDTLELEWNQNKTGVSCIKPGIYICRKWWSPHFNRFVYRLEDKNGRKDCLIHPATWAGDVGNGEFTQLHGCTSVGKGYKKLMIPDGTREQMGIINSRVTLDALFAATGGDDIRLAYRYADGCEPDDMTDAQEQ